MAELQTGAGSWPGAPQHRALLPRPPTRPQRGQAQAFERLRTSPLPVAIFLSHSAHRSPSLPLTPSFHLPLLSSPSTPRASPSLPLPANSSQGQQPVLSLPARAGRPDTAQVPHEHSQPPAQPAPCSPSALPGAACAPLPAGPGGNTQPLAKEWACHLRGLARGGSVGAVTCASAWP